MLGAQPVPQWQEAARLVIAWLATDEYPERARALLKGLDPKALWGAGEVLHGRVLARLGDREEPELSMGFPPHQLPATSDRYMALVGLERLGGAPESERGISGLSSYDFVEGNEAGTYLAEADAPNIVAYARDEPSEGDEWLSRYIDLHASNPYALYRNRSLISVLAAVCFLPDPEQARRHAARLTTAAFAPSPVQFAEFARLACVGWQVRSNSQARQILDDRVASAVEDAEQLQWSHEAADRWGHHARRLAAHAEVAHLVLGDTAGAGTLINTAMQVPFGYAGYRAPASLAVAEAAAIAASDDPVQREAALDAALASAHNIQEPAFCALMTARVNTITNWWRSAPLDDLTDLVEAFVRDPSSSRFSPRHRLGEAFEQRSQDDHLSTDHITSLNSPQDLALELGLPLLAITRLNADADPATVVLPDPGFAPMVAAHLAARVTASPLPATQRARLIAGMLPVAARDVTCLDQLLGRLLCVRGVAVAEEPALLGILDQQVTREPTGAWR